MDERLAPDEARRLIRQALDADDVEFSQHAIDEMGNDGLDVADCRRILRAGVVEEPEWERGSWRYRVRTRCACVVVAFDSMAAVIVVTAWRLE